MPTTAETSPPCAPRRVDQLLAHYAESHRNPTNEAIHLVAIPLIMLSLVGMLFALHSYAAYAFVAASLVYYARLSAVFFVAMLLWSVMSFLLCFALGNALLPVSLAVFVGAWVLQFIGHRLGGKKPSFFEDMQYLWVGPLFVLSRLLAKAGVSW